MKKLLTLMMAIIMTLSLAACGGKDTTDSAQSSSEGTGNTSTATETEFAPMTFGYITMKVPNVFGEVTEQGGMYVSSGHNASIVVTPVMEVDIEPSEWDESIAKDVIENIYSSTYSNPELAAFEGDINMNGNKAVFFGFYGKNSNGIDRMVQMIRIYNADLTGQYMISLVHDTDDEFFTAEIAEKIINSITLAPEAQNMAPQPEG